MGRVAIFCVVFGTLAGFALYGSVLGALVTIGLMLFTAFVWVPFILWVIDA